MKLIHIIHGKSPKQKALSGDFPKSKSKKGYNELCNPFLMIDNFVPLIYTMQSDRPSCVNREHELLIRDNDMNNSL